MSIGFFNQSSDSATAMSQTGDPNQTVFASEPIAEPSHIFTSNYALSRPLERADFNRAPATRPAAALIGLRSGDARGLTSRWMQQEEPAKIEALSNASKKKTKESTARGEHRASIRTARSNPSPGNGRGRLEPETASEASRLSSACGTSPSDLPCFTTRLPVFAAIPSPSASITCWRALNP